MRASRHLLWPPPPPRLHRPCGCESWWLLRTSDRPPADVPPGRSRRAPCSPYPAAPDRTPDTGLLMDRCGRRPQASQDGWRHCPCSSGSHLRHFFFIWQTHKHRDPYFQGAFLRFPAKRDSKVLGPLSLLGASVGLGVSGRRRCAFLQWFACLMKKMSDMLPPPSDGQIVGRAPFRTAGRLLRPHVTSATASRAPARARPPLVAVAESLPGHHAPFGWSVSINVCALWSYS